MANRFSLSHLGPAQRRKIQTKPSRRPKQALSCSKHRHKSVSHDRHELIKESLEERLTLAENTNRLWVTQLLRMIYIRIKHNSSPQYRNEQTNVEHFTKSRIDLPFIIMHSHFVWVPLGVYCVLPMQAPTHWYHSLRGQNSFSVSFCGISL